MKDFSFYSERKIKLVKNKENQSLEIGQSVVKTGLLKKLPGITLSVFIFILTHLNNDNHLEIKTENMLKHLPCNNKELKDALAYMSNHDIIEIEYISDDLLKIVPYPSILIEKKDKSTNEKNYKIRALPDNKKDYRKKIINKKNVSETELKKAILSFLPNNTNYENFNKEINKWLKDFNKNILQELIRRVEKWLKKQQNEKNKRQAFYYLRGIIDDWYNKEIFNFDRLKYFDRLYRETRELAQIYGIKWRNINPTQLETLKSWLLDDFALSSSLVKFAIKEAVKRKKDGQPSLKYIEDNFINPLKKEGIRTVREAKKYFSQGNYRRKKTNEKNYKYEKNKTWEGFDWDLS